MADGSTGHIAYTAGPTDLQAIVWAWRHANPGGTQAQLRTAMAQARIEISRGLAFNCYHDWGVERLVQFERGELSEAQVQALFEVGLLDVRGGPMPGAQKVERGWNANEL